MNRAAESESEASREAAQWVARESLRALNVAEREALSVWLASDARHHPAYIAARSAVDDLREAEAAFRRVHHDEAPVAQTGIRPRAWRVIGLVASAAALVLMFVRTDLVALMSDHGSATGEVRHLVLPDGTRVTLDTRSAIDVTYTSAAREVSLIRGRAYFEVEHDGARPFSVRVLGGEARDIGTAFVVRRVGDEAETLVTEGEVVLSSNGGDVTLTRGRGARWRRGERPGKAAMFDEFEALGWRDGNIVIDRWPLAAVVEELNRYRRSPVVLLDRQAANRTVSGVVQTGNMDKGIAALAGTQGLSAISLPFATILY